MSKDNFLDARFKPKFSQPLYHQNDIMRTVNSMSLIKRYRRSDEVLWDISYRGEKAGIIKYFFKNNRFKFQGISEDYNEEVKTLLKKKCNDDLIEDILLGSE